MPRWSSGKLPLSGGVGGSERGDACMTEEWSVRSEDIEAKCELGRVIAVAP